MTRVKRGTIAHKKREKLLKRTKGFRWGRKSKERAAKEALLHSLTRKFVGRKEKKREFRALWNVRINAGVRPEGMKYSAFINALKKKNVKLDRKILADLAKDEPAVFKKISEFVKEIKKLLYGVFWLCLNVSSNYIRETGAQMKFRVQVFHVIRGCSFFGTVEIEAGSKENAEKKVIEKERCPGPKRKNRILNFFFPLKNPCMLIRKSPSFLQTLQEKHFLSIRAF